MKRRRREGKKQSRSTQGGNYDHHHHHHHHTWKFNEEKRKDGRVVLAVDANMRYGVNTQTSKERNQKRILQEGKEKRPRGERKGRTKDGEVEQYMRKSDADVRNGVDTQSSK